MTNRRLLWSLLVLVAACSPRPMPPPPLLIAPPPPVEAHVELEVHGAVPTGEPGQGMHQEVVAPRVERDQPAHVKLKLGHYRNARHGIGVTIDLVSAATDDVADLDPAKLRFDGETKIWLLEGRHGPDGRIDYVRDRGRVLLQRSRTGRYTVYIPDPETDRASQPIVLDRDGDADPL